MPEAAAPTLRETLAATVEKLETSQPSTPAESAAPAPAAAPSAAPQAPTAPATAAPAQPGEKAEEKSAGYLQGKPPAAPAVEQKPGETQKAGEQPPAEAQKGFLKPPESWKPAVRDAHWKTLPVQVQAEIVRRERQVEATMRQAGEFKKTHEAVGQMVQHYQDVFRAEGTPPLQTIHNLLNINRAMRFAPPPQRAQYMAQIIQGFGIDLQMLDQALAYNVRAGAGGNGAQPQGDVTAIQRAIAQQLAPVNQTLQALMAERTQGQQQMDAQIGSEIEAFAADPKNEYFDLLREEVADILEMGAKRGQKITLQDAYTRAMLANNDLAPLVGRQQVEAAARAVSGPAAQAAQLANLSVTGAPSTATPHAAQPTTIRGALEAAVDKLTARS